MIDLIEDEDGERLIVHDGEGSIAGKGKAGARAPARGGVRLLPTPGRVHSGRRRDDSR